MSPGTRSPFGGPVPLWLVPAIRDGAMGLEAPRGADFASPPLGNDQKKKPPVGWGALGAARPCCPLAAVHGPGLPPPPPRPSLGGCDEVEQRIVPSSHMREQSGRG